MWGRLGNDAFSAGAGERRPTPLAAGARTSPPRSHKAGPTATLSGPPPPRLVQPVAVVGAPCAQPPCDCRCAHCRLPSQSGRKGGRRSLTASSRGCARRALFARAGAVQWVGAAFWAPWRLLRVDPPRAPCLAPAADLGSRRREARGIQGEGPGGGGRRGVMAPPPERAGCGPSVHSPVRAQSGSGAGGGKPLRLKWRSVAARARRQVSRRNRHLRHHVPATSGSPSRNAHPADLGSAGVDPTVSALLRHPERALAARRESTAELVVAGWWRWRQPSPRRRLPARLPHGLGCECAAAEATGCWRRRRASSPPSCAWSGSRRKATRTRRLGKGSLWRGSTHHKNKPSENETQKKGMHADTEDYLVSRHAHPPPPAQ